MVINNAFNVSMNMVALHDLSPKMEVLINMLHVILLTFESFVDSSAVSIALFSASIKKSTRDQITPKIKFKHSQSMILRAKSL